MRAVIDTGIFVSAVIRSRGTIGSILSALRDGCFTAIYTTEILVEIIDVLGRDKFRVKYHIEPDDVSALIHLIRLRGELVIPNQTVDARRDPKDNKFLEAALASDADWVVSGDADLLDMESFEGIPILRPAEFLAQL
jgi:putative PIN family toxin of toxin-antitoxin system